MNGAYDIDVWGLVLALGMVAAAAIISELMHMGIGRTLMWSACRALVQLCAMGFSSGIVTIPGMMAGQVIAGGDPLNAAKYQFVVFGAIAALTLLADGLIMAMVYRTCFTADDQYQPPKAR